MFGQSYKETHDVKQRLQKREPCRTYRVLKPGWEEVAGERAAFCSSHKLKDTPAGTSSLDEGVLWTSILSHHMPRGVSALQRCHQK